MEKIKSILLEGKGKVYAMVLLQGTIGLFVGNYFIRPALVTTAVVSTTIATSSLSAGPTCANGCVAVDKDGTKCDTSGSRDKKDPICQAACAVIALQVAQNQSKTTTTGTGSSSAPSALTYTGSPYTYTVGTAITTNTPTVTGTVTSCAANPTLPTGLSIAATTCAISGTPTATSAAAAYTITATNATGSTTAAINITVNAAAATACTTCKMFITTSTYTGATIGGITGADAKCASDASKPASGTYKAFLVDDTNRIACTTANCSGGASENKNWVLKANTAYTRVDGTAIGTTTAAAILPATLTNPISTTADTLFGTIRTGMAFAKDWTSRVNGHCTNYTVTTGSSTDGDAGTGTTSNYLYVNGGTCAGLKSLLCVEQ
jgi:hypothetical protein